MFIEKSKSCQGKEITLLKSKKKNFATTNTCFYRQKQSPGGVL